MQALDHNLGEVRFSTTGQHHFDQPKQRVNSSPVYGVEKSSTPGERTQECNRLAPIIIALPEGRIHISMLRVPQSTVTLPGTRTPSAL